MSKSRTYKLDSMKTKLISALANRRDARDELHRWYHTGEINFICDFVGAQETAPWFDEFTAATRAADIAALKAEVDTPAPVDMTDANAELATAPTPKG